MEPDEPAQTDALADGPTPSPAAPRRPARVPGGRPERSQPLAAAAARVGFGLAARLPLGLAYRLGGFLGGLSYLLPGRTRRLSRVNLRLCFPELDGRARARLGRRAAASTGRFVLELGGIWNRPRERVLELVREVHGEEHLRAALERGRGVIAITPHLGSWELAGLWASSRLPTTALYKPPRSIELGRWIRARRERLGARLVPAGPSGVGELVRALRRNELVAVLPDQDPGHGSGLFVPFFGVPANTSVLIPRLLARTGATPILAACVRLSGARGFALHIEPASEALGDPDVERATRALNAELERFVRRFVEQYLWSYPRFRQRPAGEPSLYRRQPVEKAP